MHTLSNFTVYVMLECNVTHRVRELLLLIKIIILSPPFCHNQKDIRVGYAELIYET